MKTPRQLPPGLPAANGPRFWKSLEEFSGSPDFLPYLHREFPEYASEWDSAIDRRRFLQLIGASLALAGLTACSRQPQEKIVPYVQRPPELTPGEPLYYATTFPHDGYGKGILVRSDDAHPTKIEGNPDHPASLGASDVFMQASVLGLYDPDRSQLVRRGKEIATWSDFLQFATTCAQDHEQDQGAGLFLLTGKSTSPTLADQLQRLRQRFPKMSWCEYAPNAPVRLPGATKSSITQPLYDFSQADLIVSLDADFLSPSPANLIHARAFSNKRRDPANGFSRLYVVESTPTITGAKADVRWRRKPSEIQALADELMRAVSVEKLHASPEIMNLAAELSAHRGNSLVIAGEHQPREVQYAAIFINQVLGNIGKTVRYVEQSAPLPDGLAFPDFLAALQSGAAKTLLIADANPIYDLASDSGFAAALQKIPHTIHLGLYDDETSALCQWHLPETHFLEAWGDLLAVDGTPSLIQPLIAPLYPDAASLHEVLSAFTDALPQRGYDIVHAFWQSRFAGDPENSWNRSLNKGVVVDLQPGALAPLQQVSVFTNSGNAFAPSSGLELQFRPDPSILDGRYANNAWLQELPRPLTKLTWDNAALISPATAARLQLETGDIVRLGVEDRSVEAPIWIQPGQADDTITAHLGYGRWNAGGVGNNVGFNANVLRSREWPWSASGVTVHKTGRTHAFATTQNHFSMEGRGLVQVEPLAQALADPGHAKLKSPAPGRDESLYPAHEYKSYAWAMSIDLNSCIGCNACILACQSENNIPVVGKDQVSRGREMQWLRVDRYFEGEPEDPQIHFQPVPCMHCEDAPCEVVCPVGATTTSSEGLNEMTYNRCVGTRYCSNNCPYKVRRFNFLQYSDQSDPVLALQKNPDVTVRSRGVMEKCTYCVQRIEEVRIRSEKEMRAIRDGEIVTACQSACPADAIVFGNINDPASRVSRLKAQPRDYGLLAELNTRPRTTYLAKVVNPPTPA
jgi:molybdopterin-containing oxidoreductase family iron-sulfur binding subunit